jgi:hypothetical protein
MKHAIEKGSVVMIYITNFIKIGSGIQKLIRGINRHTAKMKAASTYFRKVG